jgi:hypothetical protein
MDFLKEIALMLFEQISLMRSNSQQEEPAYKQAMVDFAEVKVALGVLKVGTRTLSQKEGPAKLTFINSARVGSNDYPCVKMPSMLIRATDDSTEVKLSDLTLLVSSMKSGGKFCTRLLPTYGPDGCEAIGCCWSPIEDESRCCPDCAEALEADFVEDDSVYVCHPKYYLKYSLLLKKFEAHVMAERLQAGPVDELPLFPTVYEEDDHADAARTKMEASSGATPLKRAVDAALLVSGGINSGSGGAASMYGDSEGFGMAQDDFDAGGQIDATSDLLDALFQPEELATFLESASPAHKQDMEKLAQVVKTGRTQVLALNKQLKVQDLSPAAAKQIVKDVTALLAHNTAVIGLDAAIPRLVGADPSY